ncbi:plasmid mobilization protein [Burkholderia glumae]|uniref:plasmid mobilization protein n=1 Tax=Burkholderia glumae TaxID=337 RepID=UPI0015935672|nr:hypothetical protein [Burkholderia glumae]NVE26306.1 hypothetical protein [Burkholderia glumae]
MPRSSGTSKGKSFPLTIRLNRDENQHYRSKANEAGLSVSEYCRQKLARGQLGDGLAQLENRLTALITAVQQIAAQIAATPVPAPAAPGAERVQSSGIRLNKVQQAQLEAVFTSAEILGTIAHDRSPQVRDRAQDAARAKIRELTGGAHD